ncbi:MAG: site-specific integrase [archaeon]
MALDSDIYHSAKQLERGLTLLTVENGFRKQDVKDILDYLNEMSALGIKPIRLKKQLYVLRALSRIIKKPFRKCNKQDLMELTRKIDAVKEHRDWTKYDRRVVLKRFYRWMNNGEYPDCIKWMKLKDPKNSILPEELITEEEILRVVDSAKYLRDKALIYSLYESGCRIGELLTLQIKNVSFGEHITSLIVCGKTGQRRVPLISSTSYLSMWLSMHPFKDNPNAPLWNTIVDKYHPGKMNVLSYKGLQKMLAVNFKRAGVKKRASAHLFRHSRATSLAKHLTEAQLKELFGWTQASDMTARYVHLSGRDVDKAIMKLHGINVFEKEDMVLFNEVTCQRCNERNPSSFSLCKRCGAALNTKTAVELKSKGEGLALEFLQTMIKDFQAMQSQGIDLVKFNEFIESWSKSNFKH